VMGKSIATRVPKQDLLMILIQISVWVSEEGLIPVLVVLGIIKRFGRQRPYLQLRPNSGADRLGI